MIYWILVRRFVVRKIIMTDSALREDMKKGVYIFGNTEEIVQSPNAGYEVLNNNFGNRRYFCVVHVIDMSRKRP
jgi:hypothetical protein